MMRNKYRCTNMNAETLLDYLQQGAKLKSWWVNGKCVHSIRLSSGEVIYTQRSNISALVKRGFVRSIAFSGDNYEYYLVERVNV